MTAMVCLLERRRLLAVLPVEFQRTGRQFTSYGPARGIARERGRANRFEIINRWGRVVVKGWCVENKDANGDGLQLDSCEMEKGQPIILSSVNVDFAHEWVSDKLLERMVAEFGLT